jgi:hypothetical protein
LVVVLPSVTVRQLMAKKLVVSVHHLVTKAAASVLVLVLVMVLVLVLVLVLVMVVELHNTNHQASLHQAMNMVEMQDMVVDLAVDLVVDLNLHHLHSNQAHTEVVLVVLATVGVLAMVVLVVLVVSMLLLLLSETLILTKMGVSIVRNSAVSTNKVYK